MGRIQIVLALRYFPIINLRITAISKIVTVPATAWIKWMYNAKYVNTFMYCFSERNEPSEPNEKRDIYNISSVVC